MTASSGGPAGPGGPEVEAGPRAAGVGRDPRSGGVGPRQLLRRFMTACALAWRAKPALAAGYLLCTIFAGVLPTAIAWLTKLLLDRLTSPGGHSSSDVSYLALELGAIGLLTAALPHASHYLRNQLQRAVTFHVQDQLFVAVNRFAGLGRFEDPEFLDRLRLAQQSGAAAPDQSVSAAFGAVQGAISAVGLLGTLIYLSPLMAGAVLLSAVPSMVTQLAASRRRAAMMWGTSGANRRQTTYRMLLTDHRAAQEVRLFGLGDFLRTRLLEHVREVNAAERGIERRVLRTQGPLSLFGAAIAAAGLFWAVRSTASGHLSLGDLSVFIAAVAGVQVALSAIVGGVADGYQAALVFGHYLAVTDAPPDLAEAEHPVAMRPLSRSVALRDVWFRYSEDGPWVLRGVDVEIPKGTTAAIVGVNGAGKSTLVKLLCRFYDPTAGTVAWDGVDVRNVPVADLRARMTAVFQDYMEYDLSAAENIGVGDLPRIDVRAGIEGAARGAEIHEKLAALPKGYDTLLSRIFFAGSDPDDPDVGVRLSGGQWQRVALARGLLREGRDLLILDEPSSGLDAEAEQSIHERLREHRDGATSILISHRLSAVRHADVILVLSDGRLTERGSHAELMAAEGEYARLFTLQAQGYQEADEPEGSWAEAVGEAEAGETAAHEAAVDEADVSATSVVAEPEPAGTR